MFVTTHFPVGRIVRIVASKDWPDAVGITATVDRTPRSDGAYCLRFGPRQWGYFLPSELEDTGVDATPEIDLDSPVPPLPLLLTSQQALSQRLETCHAALRSATSIA